MPVLQEDETSVLQQCRSGSRQAFEHIVKRYMKDSYFIALGLVGSRDDALELSQEAFVRAYMNIKTLRSDRQFFPWFYQILRNLCFSHLRKLQHRRTASLDEVGEETFVYDGNNRFSPDDISQRDEAGRQLWEAIGKLPEHHREVIVMRHFHDLSYEQIAANLHCSKGTVMSRLYHARRKLKELLSHLKGGQI